MLRTVRNCYRQSIHKPSIHSSFVEDYSLALHLLPCLVVALLNVLNDPTAETKTKEWCLHFVDMFIKTFEMHEMEMINSSEDLEDIYLNFLGGNDQTLFTKSLERIKKAIPAELIADGGALEHLRQYLDFFTTEQDMCKSMFAIRFFHRVEFVVSEGLPASADDRLDQLMETCR